MISALKNINSQINRGSTYWKHKVFLTLTNENLNPNYKSPKLYVTHNLQCNYSCQYISFYILHIPIRSLHNRDTGSPHFCQICNKLKRGLAMLTYIYLNVNECWLSSFMPQQSFKLQIFLNYANNLVKCIFLMRCWWPC